MVFVAWLVTYSSLLAGLALLTWLISFRIRKTFRGGVFWDAWRVITASPPFFMVHHMVLAYQAAYGFSFLIGVISDSFEGIALILLLLGFYLFYKAWNPKALAGGG